MKKKVVLLNSCKGLYGGVESFLLNIFKRLDKELFEITFLTCGKSTYDMFRDEIESEGGRVDCINIYPSNFLSEIKVYKKLRNYFKIYKPDVVHINSSGLSFQVLASSAAQKEGINNIILHSHNFVPNISKLKRYSRSIMMPLLSKKGNFFLSCSKGASEWMFESKIQNKVEVIPNGINTEDFKFSIEKRHSFLDEINISESNLILGNIGRFQTQKNHKFMIDILRHLLNKNENVYLLLVGEGELKEEIVEYAKEMYTFEHIIFLGERKDIGAFLSAIDVFIFPSLFEGFGIAALEAQASGAYTIVSDTIPKEVNVTGNVQYLSIDNPLLWANTIENLTINHDRLIDNYKVSQSIYDADKTAERMSEIYLA